MKKLLKKGNISKNHLIITNYEHKKNKAFLHDGLDGLNDDFL